MIKEIKNNNVLNFLRIEYMLGNVCNYKCSYCFPGSNEGTMPWPDINQTKINLSHLLSYFEKQGVNKFQFYLIGGEPTIWKELPELVLFLKERFDVTFNISTNASMSLNWWEKNCHVYDNIEISVHHEFCDPDHILKVGDLLYSKNTFLVANVLMDPNHFNKCQHNLDHLLTSNFKWPIVAKSVHYNGQTRYNADQAEFLKSSIKRMPDLEWYEKVNKNPVEKRKIWIIKEDDSSVQLPSDNWFALNNLNYFKGWTCNLGVEHLKIDQDGTISGNCKNKIWNLETPYNLYSTNFISEFKPIVAPTVCEQHICQCTSEITINKKKYA
jgi:organic radical activating enzyme